MKVALHLRRRPSPEPASAVLLETDRVEALLDLASKLLGLDRSPTIHRVAGGFLLKLGEGSSLRWADPAPSLAENLYLPVDADLVPALLDDEARGVTRDRA